VWGLTSHTNEYREKVNGRECNLHVTPGPNVCRECVREQIKRLGIMHKKEKKTLRRNASGPKAQGADSQGERYYVQLALEGLPYQNKNLPSSSRESLSSCSQ
jgi:hypothetical protein